MPFAPSQLQAKAQRLIAQQDWQQAARLLEQATELEPEVKLHFWHLGLSFLMLGREDEAQLTWFIAMSEGKESDIAQWTRELFSLLDIEAERQQQAESHSQAWTLRQHMRELDPANLNNLLLLTILSVKLSLFQSEQLVAWNVDKLLKQSRSATVSLSLLTRALADVLSYCPIDAILDDFVDACASHFQIDSPPVQPFIARANCLAYRDRRPDTAVQLLVQARRLIPDSLPLLQQLSCFHQDVGQHDDAIAVAQSCLDISPTLVDRIASSHILLKALMGVGSDWGEIERRFQQHLALIDQLTAQAATGSLPQASPAITRWLFTVPFFQPYLRDDLAKNRKVQNQVAAIAHTCTQRQRQQHISRYQVSAARGASRLKIGYVSACLRRHSVGWLARWLYQYHNREQVQIYSYLVNYQTRDDPLRDWYIERSDVAHKLDAHGPHIADRVYDDDINILVDLDSLTLYTTCDVMAMKPAPIQASWLGWDASGIPAIDYYIVDPYVLPEDAENHYSETLWRLPQTYVAVDGFEVNAPSLRRCDLNIPTDAIVYLSAQRGYKRHPHTIRLQLQILREVPQSYFLIKAMTLDDSLKALFVQIAEEEGVSPDRLRFLTGVPEEATHRANLAIADVVLDTYPYNGATTTMEVLWMGIPLVARVGKTFSSRNSYTMMRNAGISEGIAWSDDEYVDWGVRFGRDPGLRQQVAWKLLQGRRSAPLWNARQFAQEMEQAYRQMWERYASAT